MADARRSKEPIDRLTRVCGRITDMLEADPEHREGDKAIIMLDDGARGGLVLLGYENDADAMVDLLTHVKALFEANGKTLVIAPLGRG